MYKIRNFSHWLVHDTQKGTREEGVTRMKCVLLIRNNVLIIHRVYGHLQLVSSNASHPNKVDHGKNNRTVFGYNGFNQLYGFKCIDGSSIIQRQSLI